MPRSTPMQDINGLFRVLLPYYVSTTCYLTLLLISHLAYEYSDYETITPRQSFLYGALVLILKCFPVAYLIYFTFCQDPKPREHKFYVPQGAAYRSLIALGMSFGLIADAFLVFRDGLFYGMMMYGIQFLIYTYAMGFRPIKPAVGVVFFLISLIVLSVLRRNFPDELVKRVMPYYSAVLTTFCWRAVARMNLTTWRTAGALGGIMFVFSEVTKLLEYHVHVPCGEVIIVFHYFAAQWCIALTAVDSTTVPPNPILRRPRIRTDSGSS